MLRFHRSFVLAALILVVPGVALADDRQPSSAQKAPLIGTGAVTHQLFLRELAGLASAQSPSDVKLTEEQLKKLREIQIEYRAALANVPAGAEKAGEKVSEARKAIDAARAAKKKTVDELRSKIEQKQAQADALRAERDALKGPERAAKKQQIDALRAEIDSLQATLKAAREESRAEIDEAKEKKGEAAIEQRETIQSLRSAADEGGFRARMLEVLTPAQRTALEKRLAEAEAAIRLIDAGPASKNN